MESHPYEITPGEGVSPVPELEQYRCQHMDACGHYCRMLAANGSPLCPHHARKAQRREPEAIEALAADLLDEVDNFQSPEDVNIFLGNLVKQVVRKRVSRPDACTLAYLSQLLLNSFTAMNSAEDRAEYRAQQEEEEAQEEEEPTKLVFVDHSAYGVPRSIPDDVAIETIRRKRAELAEKTAASSSPGS
jgi:hypothetical protein